jgi:hypothetical protein
MNSFMPMRGRFARLLLPAVGLCLVDMVQRSNQPARLTGDRFAGRSIQRVKFARNRCAPLGAVMQIKQRAPGNWLIN